MAVLKLLNDQMTWNLQRLVDISFTFHWILKKCPLRIPKMGAFSSILITKNITKKLLFRQKVILIWDFGKKFEKSCNPVVHGVHIFLSVDKSLWHSYFLVFFYGYRCSFQGEWGPSKDKVCVCNIDIDLNWSCLKQIGLGVGECFQHQRQFQTPLNTLHEFWVFFENQNQLYTICSTREKDLEWVYQMLYFRSNIYYHWIDLTNIYILQ